MNLKLSCGLSLYVLNWGRCYFFLNVLSCLYEQVMRLTRSLTDKFYHRVNMLSWAYYGIFNSQVLMTPLATKNRTNILKTNQSLVFSVYLLPIWICFIQKYDYTYSCSTASHHTVLIVYSMLVHTISCQHIVILQFATLLYPHSFMANSSR